MRTQADKEQELSERKLRINMHYEQVINRAPELVFFRSRMETEKLGNKFLKSMYVNMCLRPLTDIQVESAQKVYETLLAQKLEYSGSAPAPDGITHVQGFIQETYRSSAGTLRHNEPNRPKVLIREDRGFMVQITAPVLWIQEAGTLSKLIGRRVAFTTDLTPVNGDHTVAIKRPKQFGGDSVMKNVKLYGNHFDDIEESRRKS